MEKIKMFATKQNQLFTIPSKKIVTSGKNTKSEVIDNPFIQFGLGKAAEIKSDNGSLKYKTSGYSNASLFVDQFASLAFYKAPRTFEAISSDMEKLWAADQEMTVKFVVYLRMITRTASFLDGTKTKTTQRGGGLKHEGITRMIWLAVNAPETFNKNLGVFITAGSWNDLIKMLSYDVQYNGWNNRLLDWEFIGNVILLGLQNPNTTNLVRKYLPQIKANTRCKTLESQADNVIAKWICSLIFGSKNDEKGITYKAYREIKKTGTAHQWQQLISKGNHSEIDFNSVHGRALAAMASGKFLKNQGLEDKYQQWIASKPVAKFTGYPYELAQMTNTGVKQYQKDTINAQFNMLVEVAKKGLTSAGLRPISVLDCSGSMDSPMYIGSGKVGKLRSIEVAFSSAIFFNEMMDNSSPFYNTYLSFSNTTEMNRFTGNNFVDKYKSTSRRGYGGTNFETVFDYLVNFKRANPNVDENLIPNFIVCFSDGEFNAVSGRVETNVEAGRRKLSQVYSKEFCDSFGICFVDLPNTFNSYRNNKPKFETFGNSKNTFYFSGYDLSPLGFLFGVEGKVNKETGEISVPKTSEELFYASMDQELINLVEI